MPDIKIAPRAAEPGLPRRENGFVDRCMAAAPMAIARSCFSENSALISFLRTHRLFKKAQGLLDKLSFLRNSAFQKLSFYQLLRETQASALRKNSAFISFWDRSALIGLLGKLSFLRNSAFQKTQLLSAFCEDNG